MAGDRIVLVKHAMPDVDPAVPPPRWQLGAAGRTAARALAELLPAEGHLVASTEPKAIDTLREATGLTASTVDSDEGFDEVRRPDVWLPDHRVHARSYVEGRPPEGWEPPGEVAARFDAAVRRHADRAASAGRTLVVGGHGMSMTVWLASRLRLDPDPGEFWAALRFPDVLDVDLSAGTVARRS